MQVNDSINNFFTTFKYLFYIKLSKSYRKKPPIYYCRLFKLVLALVLGKKLFEKLTIGQMKPQFVLVRSAHGFLSTIYDFLIMDQILLKSKLSYFK